MSSSEAISEPLARLERIADALKTWLFASALPLWWQIGADRVSGGFYEKLDPDGDPVEEPRRARVVARQLFVYATAARMGWQGPAHDVIDHALLSLRSQHLTADARVIPLRRHTGEIVSASFDLYDSAFVLFGLAAAATAGRQADIATATASAILEAMQPFRNPRAGFEEAVPRILPLKANPHMHMLEACLAWEAASDDPRWRGLADEIAELALAQFIASSSGALHEYFDGDWQPLAGDPNDIVEPGHQFEWAWLLMRWGVSRKHQGARAAAARLVAIGEGPGVDPVRRLAIDGLAPDLAPMPGNCRLWPQTERIKAWAISSVLAPTPETRRHALERTSEAASGLLRYIHHPVAGSWWENIGQDGAPLIQPARASSLYHITCAIFELETALAALRTP